MQCAVCLLAIWPLTSSASLSVLTNAVQVRELNLEEAKKAFPVRLCGVVTFVDLDWFLFFIQDSTAGIFVSADKPAFTLKAGQAVEVEGVSGPGDYAPIIAQAKFKVLGEAPLPRARQPANELLFSGKEDSQWMEVQGVVHRIFREGSRLTLDMVIRVGRLSATIPDFAQGSLPEHLVDATGRVQGACATIFNKKRQLIGVQIYVPALEFVSVLEAPLTDPFALPIRPVNSLLRFTPQEAAGHRVKVRRWSRCSSRRALCM